MRKTQTKLNAQIISLKKSYLKTYILSIQYYIIAPCSVLVKGKSKHLIELARVLNQRAWWSSVSIILYPWILHCQAQNTIFFGLIWNCRLLFEGSKLPCPTTGRWRWKHIKVNYLKAYVVRVSIFYEIMVLSIKFSLVMRQHSGNF